MELRYVYIRTVNAALSGLAKLHTVGNAYVPLTLPDYMIHPAPVIVFQCYSMHTELARLVITITQPTGLHL